MRAFDWRGGARQAEKKGARRAGSRPRASPRGGGDELPAESSPRVYESSVIGAAPKSAILIDCSTIECTARARSRSGAQGYGMVDAPGPAASRPRKRELPCWSAQREESGGRADLQQWGKRDPCGPRRIGQAAKICNDALRASMIATARPRMRRSSARSGTSRHRRRRRAMLVIPLIAPRGGPETPPDANEGGSPRLM